MLRALARAASDPDPRLGDLARRITDRDKRFALLYEPFPDDLARNADSAGQVGQAAIDRYGEDAVRTDSYGKIDDPYDFSVQRRNGEVVSSTGVSEVLRGVPTARFEYVFLDRQHVADGQRWLRDKRDELIAPIPEEQQDE